MPEVRRLLLARSEAPAQRLHRWAWSVFRRRHQAHAKQCHANRRARADRRIADPPLQTLLAPPPALTDARWRRIVPLLPAASGTGRPSRDHRAILSGILWVMQTGSAWNALPATFGPWATVHGRYQRWRQDGTWAAILAALVSADHDCTP